MLPVQGLSGLDHRSNSLTSAAWIVLTSIVVDAISSQSLKSLTAFPRKIASSCAFGSFKYSTRAFGHS